MRLYALGLIVLCLSPCVACSRTKFVPVPQRLALPEHLTRPVPEPEFTGLTNRDLLEWGLNNRDALRACNADKAALAEMGKP